MILRPFLGNDTLVLFLLIPVIAVFATLNYFFPYHVPFHYVDLGLWGKATWIHGLWVPFVTGAIVGLNALQLNILFNRHEFLDKNNYGPSLFYVTFMSFSHSFYQVDGLLISQMIWLQALRIMFELRQNEDGRRIAFNASLFIGLAATFHIALGGMMVFAWIAFFSLKPLTVREWLLSLLGFCAPLASAVVYWWYSGHRLDASLLHGFGIVRHERIVYYATSVAIIALMLLSVVGIQVRLRKSSIRFKKLSRVLVWILVGSVLLGTGDLLFYQQIEWFNFMFIPLSFFFTFAFIMSFWKTVATFFFYTTFALAVVKFFIASHLLI